MEEHTNGYFKILYDYKIINEHYNSMNYNPYLKRYLVNIVYKHTCFSSNLKA